MGEDTSLGYLRNMAHPTAFSDPDHLIALTGYATPMPTMGRGPLQLRRAQQDRRAADRRRLFNRVVIAPLGTQKVAAIFYELR